MPLSCLLLGSLNDINLAAKLYYLFNHILCGVPADIVIIYNYKIFHNFIIKIKLAYLHKAKLLPKLHSFLNKCYNIMKISKRGFFFF